MTTNMENSVPGARRVARYGMACAALATLFLAGGMPAAIAQQPDDPMPNRVFANCVLETTDQGNRINTVAGLQEDIDNANPGGNADKIQFPAVIAYVVVYAVSNDNNGQALEDKQGNLTGDFTGPVICINPDLVDITTALQTNPDLEDKDILDIQDALILRHTPTGGPASDPDANRICHTTDGDTDCFDIE